MSVKRVEIYQALNNLIYVRTKGTGLNKEILLEYFYDDSFTSDEIILIFEKITKNTNIFARQNFINSKIEILKNYIEKIANSLEINVLNTNRVNISNIDPIFLLFFNFRFLQNKIYFFIKSFVTDSVNEYVNNSGIDYSKVSEISNWTNNDNNNYNEAIGKEVNDYNNDKIEIDNSFMELIDIEHNNEDKEFIEVEFKNTKSLDEMINNLNNYENDDKSIEEGLNNNIDSFGVVGHKINVKNEPSIEEINKNQETKLIFHYIDEVRDDLILTINESTNLSNLKLIKLLDKIDKLEYKLDEIIGKINRNLKK